VCVGGTLAERTHTNGGCCCCVAQRRRGALNAPAERDTHRLLGCCGHHFSCLTSFSACSTHRGAGRCAAAKTRAAAPDLADGCGVSHRRRGARTKEAPEVERVLVLKMCGRKGDGSGWREFWQRCAREGVIDREPLWRHPRCALPCMLPLQTQHAHSHRHTQERRRASAQTHTERHGTRTRLLRNRPCRAASGSSRAPTTKSACRSSARSSCRRRRSHTVTMCP
jgi:hypothetical protein